MRRLAVRHHDFAKHEHAVGARGIGEDGDRLQNAIRAVALGLHGRAAVEAPQRQLLERRERAELLDLRLAAQVRSGVYPSSQMYSSLYFAMGFSWIAAMSRIRLDGAPRRARAAISALSTARLNFKPTFATKIG